MKRVRTLIVIILAALPAAFYSCDSDDINIFSKSDDAQLGMELSTEIRNNPQEYPIYTGDPSVKSYITQRIFNHIVASSKVENKNIFPYQVEIIDNDSVLNAFALPGGYIYVYTGLLKYLDTEAALAGVLGHEIAHSERRHSTQRLTQYYGISVLLGYCLGRILPSLPK